MRISGLRPLVWVVVTVVATLAVLDAGSVLLTRVAVPDQAREAGYAAAEAAQDRPVDRQTARVALVAAREQAGTTGNTVRARDFVLRPDGRVSLTAGRTAPTLLLHRIPQLRHLARVTESVTVAPLPYS
jgi:hypothetical protein